MVIDPAADGPPPTRDFWLDKTYPLQLQNGRTYNLKLQIEVNSLGLWVPSPSRESVSYSAELDLSPSNFDIGVSPDEKSFFPLRSFKQSDEPKFVLDVRNRSLFIFFQLSIRQVRRTTATDVADPTSLFRIRIKFFELSKVWVTQNDDTKQQTYVILLDTPPTFHRQSSTPTFSSETSFRTSDTWYRQTSVVHNPLTQANITTSLRKKGQIIDIGRWNVFKIVFRPEDNDTLNLIQAILNDHNIIVQEGRNLKESTERPEAVWRWIDLTEPNKDISELESLYDPDFVHLPFPVRYQLEVCLSNRYFSEYAVTKEFLLKLVDLGDTKGKELLEHVATNRIKYHNPMDIFNLPFYRGVRTGIPKRCCFMRTARVTPTTIYYNTPTVDTSNRVTRRYIEFADRFLRVRFTDELTQGRIHSSFNDTNDETFTRIKRTLTRGITVGDRRYEFLAFGNSQFREHGAYFFAPTPDLTAAHIRAWMGQFNHIRNIAKCAARLGQCFSTTLPVVGSPVTLVQCEEVVRNGFTFSDGVGKISKFLAEMTFRLGGCKGLLVVSSDPKPKEIFIRPSQFKFEAEANGLEIIRWSRYYPATLNRQMILVLSALKISDKVIRAKLDDMLKYLNKAMSQVEPAINLLRKFVDPNQITVILAQMVKEGFTQTHEPFVTSMLQLWKAWHMKNLKEKAHIVIDQGANLFGCMDEFGVLKGIFNHKHDPKRLTYSQKLEALPEIFVQICRWENQQPEVITGLCLLARNPTLHAGDIRVVNAVDKPELRYLHDVVVLPRTGDRDLASMCSGGDLDGDDYLVFWDQELIPKNWFMPPMSYPSNKAPDLHHDVTVDEITSFFVTYMKNDSLPRIAHAHMAQADRLEYGVLEHKCKLLARLHSDAVDYVKTGSVANMDRDLEPQLWPHFMEKRNKRPEHIYQSKKILGQIYDAVETNDFAPMLNLPFDARILNSDLVPASEKFLEFAADLKVDYDSAMRRIMAQFDIKTEFEVWSTFVMSHNCLCRDYKIHEDLGRVAGTLREGFRQTCYEKVGGRTFEEAAPLALALYSVTNDEMKHALSAQEEGSAQGDYDDAESVGSDERSKPKQQLPLISFPWIFHDFLGKLATGNFRMPAKEEAASGAAPRAQNKIFTQDDMQKLLEDLRDLDLGKGADAPAPLDEASQASVHLAENVLAQGSDPTIKLESRVPMFEPPCQLGEIQPKDDELSGAIDYQPGEAFVEHYKENMNIVELSEDTGVEPSALDKLLSLVGDD
ncbi:hypothetical protein N7454_010624 [Penicillium verhagenii]|nr:hypothetical protein N7454_010624 [Penicillium verhagenii]